MSGVPAIASWLDQLLTLGGFGLLLALLLARKVLTRGEYDELRADRDAWRTASEAERAARERAEQASREALESTKTLAALLSEVRAHQLGGRR